MARVHSHAARASGAHLRAIVGSHDASTARAVKELGFERGCRTLAELLGDDSIDVVHICTPNALHYDQVTAVLDSGKHVVCEKPISLTSEDASVLVRLSAGCVATVPFVYRFHPMVREARARVLEGKLGKLYTLHGSYLQDWLLQASDNNWRVDERAGGTSRAFSDIGSHLVDMIEFVSGETIARVCALTRTVHPRRSSDRPVTNEDAACLIVETASGVIGTLAVSQVAAGRKNQLTFELLGEKGSVAFENERPETLWLGGRGSSELLVRDANHLSPEAKRLSTLPAGHPMGYQDAFNAFTRDTYDAVLGRIPFGLPTFVDGLRAVRLTESVIESARLGEWVLTAIEPNKVEPVTTGREQ
ncbi:oxidoreductase [Subtercola boreus]|uniref:Oxidoreductase n=2 Tax=Subtercola boreus TaxID=120213 RepID=A0A3E0W6W3_9MICO|nr:oxidoreductase [Subtercola boreus]